MSAQRAQYNKFVKSKLKNYALMKLTIVSMDLENDQASTKNIELNEIVVRGGQLSYKSIKHVVSVILIATVFFLYFSDPLFMEGLLHYIAPFRPS